MKVKYFTAMLFLTSLLFSACQSQDPGTPAASDSQTDLSGQIQFLRQQMTEQREILEKIKTDVEVITKTIEEAKRSQGQPQDQKQTVSIDDDYIKGKPSAKLTLIEFSDFQCPFCARFYRETLPLIDKDYIQTGKVRMVYRDYPIENIHPDAMKAAEAAQCAGEQGMFWKMHDKLFDNHKELSVDQIKKYAREMGLSAVRFDGCLDSGKYAEEVRKDLADGQAIGVQGTPTFFLGYTDKDKTIQGIPIRGARPYLDFKQAFEKMLKEQ